MTSVYYSSRSFSAGSGARKGTCDKNILKYWRLFRGEYSEYCISPAKDGFHLKIFV